MASSSSRKILLALLVFSLILPAAEFLVARRKPSQQAADSQLPAGWKTYHHAGVPFEFSYPGEFLLEAQFKPRLGFSAALMKKPGTSWLVDIDFKDRAEYPTDPDSKKSLEEFAIAWALTACQADGPEGSESCPSVKRKQTFKNQNGLEVVELYLNHVNESYDPPNIEKTVIGPIEAVLLPTGRSGQVLTFRHTEEDQKGLVNDDLLKRIVHSVRLAP